MNLPTFTRTGLQLAEQAVAEVRRLARRFWEWLKSLFGSLETVPGNNWYRGLRDIGVRTRSTLAQALHDVQVTSWIAGAGTAIKPIAKSLFVPQSLPIEPPPTSSIIYPIGSPRPEIEFPILDHAGKILQESQVMSPVDFYRVSADMRGNAFTISGDITQKTTEKVREILEGNIQNITNREVFSKTVEEQLGTLPISESRLEQVFRNNTNAAYSDGGESALRNEMVGSAFPYRAYYAIHDERVRHEHLAIEKMGLSGTNVFHKDDPFWLIFRPPWEWNCRCGWAPFTKRQAARHGVREAQEWIDTGVEPAHANVPLPDFRPPASWQRGAELAI